MGKIVYLFALVALAQVVYSLDCWSCQGKECEEKTAWKQVPGCGKTVNGKTQVGACLRQVYTDTMTKKDTTRRKCVIADKNADGKINFACSDGDGKTSVCDVCTTDYCNSASGVNFSFLTLLGVVAVYLIPKIL